MTGAVRPILSVVVAATDSPRAVGRALSGLSGRGSGRAEVIVAAGFAPSGPDPGVRWVEAPPGSGVPRLRWLGLEAARGRVVAFTEDSCIAAPGWVEAWLAAFADPTLDAASGVVEHADGASAVDWAVVFCEYAPFLPPTRAGPPARLAGNNFAATRDVALRAPAGEVHEVALLADVRRAGGAVRTVAGARVRHVRRYGLREAIGDRLRSGLGFGRLRASASSTPARLAATVAGPAIFAAQAGRVAAAALRDPRRLGPFADALPITLALLAAWSVGEWAGWCLGAGADPPIGCRRRGTSGRTPEPRSDRPGWPGRHCKPKPGDA